MSIHRPAIGILYFLIAWLFFTVMTLITRFASMQVPLATILLFQNLIGLFSVMPWLSIHGWSLLHTQRFGLISFRTVASLVAIALSFLAVQRISLVNTMLLQNSAPLWLPFVILLWRKTPINHKLWPGLIIGFIGIILILRPGKEIIELGALFGLGAGILQSINMVSLRVLSYSERNHTVMFYYFFIASLLCLPFSIMEWQTPGSLQWAQIAAIGVFFAAGQWAFVRAFHHAKASQLGPFCYSAIVFAVLLDLAIYSKIPDLWAWIGILLVCFGGIWSIRLNQSQSLR